uniref:Uncharacterized protein n=1 Tax=Oryza glumipatula TaxID=40148 RepID=A0A0E0AIB3_9ORYZ
MEDEGCSNWQESGRRWRRRGGGGDSVAATCYRRRMLPMVLPAPAPDNGGGGAAAASWWCCRCLMVVLLPPLPGAAVAAAANAAWLQFTNPFTREKRTTWARSGWDDVGILFPCESPTFSAAVNSFTVLEQQRWLVREWYGLNVRISKAVKGKAANGVQGLGSADAIRHRRGWIYLATIRPGQALLEQIKVVH